MPYGIDLIVDANVDEVALTLDAAVVEGWQVTIEPRFRLPGRRPSCTLWCFDHLVIRNVVAALDDAGIIITR